MKNNASLWVRLRLAWAAFRMQEGFYISVGEPKVQNFLTSERPCKKGYYENHPCSNPANVCTGRDRYRLSVTSEPEDYEYCTEHQKAQFGFVPKMTEPLITYWRKRRGSEPPQ